MSVDALNNSKGIAGTQAYMHPEVLSLINAVTKGETDDDFEVDAELLFSNDSFGAGCVVAFLCSGGIHPFGSSTAKMNDVPANIQAHRRVKLDTLKIYDPQHTELVDHLTTWKDNEFWTVTKALRLSSVFKQSTFEVGEGALMDQLALLKPPSSLSCEDELSAPALVGMCPLLPAAVLDIRKTVQQLVANEASLPKALDISSYVASL